jgi:exodeoxyribonuclease VII small subunit
MTKEQINYAETLAKLEDILARLQDGETSLDEAIVLHEKGKELVKTLEEYLKNAEITIKRHVAGAQ